MKPLTIEELKALPVGDWVWIVDKLKERSFYAKKQNITVELQDKIDESAAFVYLRIGGSGAFAIRFYETTWLAYKNKEQSECKGEIVELPCKKGDPIWVVYLDDDNNYKIAETVCAGFNIDENPIRIITAFSCYDWVRKGNFIDKTEAERRLAELKGEKK